MRDGDGNPTHAVYGFARFLGDLIERVRPAYMAVAFDQRSKELVTATAPVPGLQGQSRAAPPEDLMQQFEPLPRVVPASGSGRVRLARVSRPTTSSARSRRRMRAAGLRATIVTRDKDLAQLIAPRRPVTGITARRGQFGYQRDRARTSACRPERYRRLPGAHRGCSRQHPGCARRWAPKTATALMKAFASLDDLYEDLDGVASLPLRGAAYARCTARRSIAKRRSSRGG